MIKVYVTAKGAARSPKTLKEGHERMIHENQLDKFLTMGIISLHEQTGKEESGEKEEKPIKKNKK